jgi:hypothetical protein
MFSDSEDSPSTQALNVSLLRSEIRFWRELIESQAARSQTRDATERMHQALALAEYRLARLKLENKPH